MTPENFCYWLQGHFEIGKPTKINPDELAEIKNHLKLALSPNFGPVFICNSTTKFDGVTCSGSPFLGILSNELKDSIEDDPIEEELDI